MVIGLKPRTRPRGLITVGGVGRAARCDFCGQKRFLCAKHRRLRRFICIGCARAAADLLTAELLGWGKHYPEAVCAPAPGASLPVPLVDGFYWIEMGEPAVAERMTAAGSVEWHTTGSEDFFVGDDRIVVLSGPLTPPPVSAQPKP